jgi:hypothetical protein
MFSLIDICTQSEEKETFQNGLLNTFSPPHRKCIPDAVTFGPTSGHWVSEANHENANHAQSVKTSTMKASSGEVHAEADTLFRVPG